MLMHKLATLDEYLQVCRLLSHMVDAVAWLMHIISFHGALQLLLVATLSTRAEEWVARLAALWTACAFELAFAC